MDNGKNYTLGALGALGVVYGDIGTSPLYAMRETLRGLVITPTDVLGILSLITWALFIVISIKYLIFVFRADNEGEGGVLALLALLKQKKGKFEPAFGLLGIFGAGLIIGDGMITPAISVTSAIEGLETISAKFDNLIVILACIVLIILFTLQSHGTGKIGNAFGPIILIWFITIGLLGLVKIIQNPMVLKAVNPYYAVIFFYSHGLQGYLILGGVFLAVTGGEALYADIGHFGKQPIRYSWFAIVLPGLLLNYFGQGANLLIHPTAIVNPFYMLAPQWFFIPLIILSTVATVIASQAVISAVFSIFKQAVLLGLYPRLPIIQTSPKQMGQIYIPQVNFFLALGTLFLVLVFRSSSGMAHAYGIAVNLDMLLTSILVACAAKKIWRWPLWRVIAIFSVFIFVDSAFLGANSHKFLTGGWIPVSFAMIVATVMYTWNKGIKYMQENFYMQKDVLIKILRQLRYKSLNQLPGVTGIFITDTYDESGGSFLHFLKLSLAVPENILIVNYTVINKPHIKGSSRFTVKHLAHRICQLTLHYGFMDTISIPKALKIINQQKILPFELHTEGATYFVEIPNVMAAKTHKTLMFHWQEKLFAFLIRNYSVNLNIEFYQLPYNRTIAIGTYCII